MRFRTIAAIASAILLICAGLSAQSMNVSHHGANTCSDIQVTYDDQPAATAQESLTIPGNVPLKINPGHNGGVNVTGADVSQFEVQVCKAARNQQDLASLRAQFVGDQLTGSSEPDRSTIFFIIKAPRSASVNITAHNGPVKVSDLAGHVELHTENGPISIRRTSGDVQAYAQNGPIDFAGDSGKISLHAVNGPVQVNLNGSHWNGEGVDASTQNGPVALYVARDYNSGVHVRTDGHSPMSCAADLCRNAGNFDERAREIEVGSGQTVINLSTHNGPVKIATAKGEEL